MALALARSALLLRQIQSPLFGVDLEKAAGTAVRAHADDAEQPRVQAQAMPRRDSGAGAHENAMGHRRAGTGRFGVGSRGDGRKLGPDRGDIGIVADNAAGVVRRFHRRLHDEAAIEASGVDHSDSTR